MGSISRIPELGPLSNDPYARRALALLKAGGQDKTGQARLLRQLEREEHKQVDLDMKKQYQGSDGYRHERRLKGRINNDIDRVDDLFYDRSAPQGKQIADVQVHRNHLHGKLMYSDQRLPKDPPQTPQELAALLAKISMGDEVKTLVLHVQVKETYVAEIKETAEPFLGVVCGNGPSDLDSILQQAHGHPNWLVGTRRDGHNPGQLLVLFYKVSKTITIRVHFQVTVQLAVVARQAPGADDDDDAHTDTDSSDDGF
ncbi:hypothetical protein JCM10207_002307 [Rhodosporidiobolus poonsookiae]